jgi:ParB-like chromosome segregation protein Spo0J
MSRRKLIDNTKRKPAASKKTKRRKSPVGRPGPTGRIGVELRRLPIKKIKRAPYNPRRTLRPGEPEYVKLHRSLEAYGLVDPLVWNKRTGNLIGGHQRLTVLEREYKATAVDVSVVDLSLADEKILNVALNRVVGEWEDVKLAELLVELRKTDGVDHTLTGYTDAESELAISAALAELSPAGGDGGDPVEATDREFGVVVTCAGKDEQRKVYDRLRRAGYTCRVLSI